MINAELKIDISNLQGVSVLRINHDAGSSITVNMEKRVEERRHATLSIKDVKVNHVRGECTITAQHQICDGPGELKLDYTDYTHIDPVPYLAYAGENALKDEPLSTSPVRPGILPASRRAQFSISS